MTTEDNKPSWWRRCCEPRLHNFFITEFSWRCLGFNHSRPTDFTESQWVWMKPWLFTIYRVLLALSMLIWISFDIPRETHRYFGNRTYIWFVYATNWTFGLLVLVFFLLTVQCLVYNCPKRDNASVILYQPLWLLYTVAVNGILVVCLVFWVALSSSDLGVFASGWGRLKHSLSGILAILDLGISAIPFRLVHVTYPILAGILYSMFSYFFWLGDLTGPVAVGQVYPGLNWAHPRAAILACLCVLLVSFLVHICLYVTYFLRVQLSAHINGRGHAAPSAVQSKNGKYDQIEAEELAQQIDEDLISVTSMSTYADMKQNHDYGTVE
ncbi:uncharacterized protein DEA37_0003886 [Paragonimus westermani]|uniref:Protein rolling stone n=1 Tax=Paragonimus westermani TaxID=34504 RepID=A0A5J4NKD3_9TREM|nr:uncharacterized protein DEA37_0003886 [Paragonimus westermani]